VVGSPSYEICRCCGFEYGCDDDDLGYTHEQWRQEWINGGMVWRRRFKDGILTNESKEQPPLNWDPRKQLLNIGIKLP